MEIIWGLWFFFGLIIGVAIMFLADVGGDDDGDYQGDAKRKHDEHSIKPFHFRSRNRDRSSSNGCPRQVETEEMIQVLDYFRVGASLREKQVLDAISERISKDGND